MHMADALISPIVGGTMLAVSAGAAVYSIKKINSDMDEKKIPLMGVMGAFVFAAQMINFTIPATGSSGHIGGGMLLSALLGPYAGFLAMAAILLIQALVFADGGLLAYGCNLINMGFFACFIAYPLIYKWMTRKGFNSKRLISASLLSVVVGLQMGAFGVVLETLLSGKTELPFGTFVLLMQPIHLAIGLVEGFVTAAVISFVWKARPEILEKAVSGEALGAISMKKVLSGLLIAVLVTGGVLSWFASSNPDGLEWSIEKATGSTELESSDNGIHRLSSDIQSKTAILPDYGFGGGSEKASQADASGSEGAWPSVNAGTSTSGIVGGALTLVLAVLTGFIIRLFKHRKKAVA